MEECRIRPIALFTLSQALIWALVIERWASQVQGLERLQVTFLALHKPTLNKWNLNTDAQFLTTTACPYLEKMLVYVTCKFREWSLKLQRSFTWGLLLPGAYEGKSVWPLHIANSAKALILVVCLCQTRHCWVWLCGKTQLCRPVSWSINAFNTVILWKRKKCGWGRRKTVWERLIALLCGSIVN